MARASFELGVRLAASPSLCCSPITAEGGFVTGMVDGRVLVWQDRSLIAAVQAHTGPVWDLDVPSVRDTWRCELTLGLGGGMKEVMVVVARGAGRAETQAMVVERAVEDWVEERCRAGVPGMTYEEVERMVRGELAKGNTHAK